MHHIADALSRAPYFPSDSTMDVDIDTVDPGLSLVLENTDAEYRELRCCIRIFDTHSNSIFIHLQCSLSRRRDYFAWLTSCHSTARQINNNITPTPITFRHLRGNLPNVCASSSPHASSLEFTNARQSTRDATAFHAGGVDLVPLSLGDAVLDQSSIDKNWSVSGTVMESLPHGRSYLIETPAGTFRRNRRFLRLSTLAPSSSISPLSKFSMPSTTSSEPVTQRRRSPRFRHVRFDLSCNVLIP
eukprot:TCALIF_13395-PA protein Name:"Protein of unknown function" AED:0.26 eAED:0.43 QI:8/0/0/1/0/0/4/0/243